MARRSARAAAMQMVYESMLGGDGGEETLRGLIDYTPEKDDQAFIDDIVEGARAHADELDALIAGKSETRELNRIARVNIAILRVALYELKYRDDTPGSVVVNEAVDLAKRYALPADGRFINGVLGSYLRENAPAADEK